MCGDTICPGIAADMEDVREDKLTRMEAPACGRQELLPHAVSRLAEDRCSNTCFFSWMTLP